MRRWLTALWRVRWWLALAFVALAFIVRLALPSVVRSAVASQASKALHTKVEVGDVALSLWRGTVGLHDVAVYPPAAGGAAQTPLIGWKALDSSRRPCTGAANVASDGSATAMSILFLLRPPREPRVCHAMQRRSLMHNVKYCTRLCIISLSFALPLSTSIRRPA